MDVYTLAFLFWRALVLVERKDLVSSHVTVYVTVSCMISKNLISSYSYFIRVVSYAIFALQAIRLIGTLYCRLIALPFIFLYGLFL